MKETGVSRRIDELGRIVIPKEIRKNLDIEHLLEVLYKKINKVILLTDLDKVIYVKGDDKYKDLDLSTRYKNILHSRKIYDGYILDFCIAVNYGKDIYSLPLINYGELYGSLIILQNKDYLLENEKEIIKIIGEYIIKKLDY